MNTECPSTSLNSKGARPVGNPDTFVCDWCCSLDLWFDCSDLCFPKLARLNVESKMVDRSHLITRTLLLGLENWIEDAQNVASNEDHAAVDITSVKKSHWIVEKMNEIASESKRKHSRKVYQNICSKEPFIPHSLPDLVEKSKNCAFKSPREALREFIRLVVATGYLTENKIITETDTFQYYKRCNKEIFAFFADITLCPDHWLRQHFLDEGKANEVLKCGSRNIILNSTCLNHDHLCCDPHVMAWDQDDELVLILRKVPFQKKWKVIPFVKNINISTRFTDALKYATELKPLDPESFMTSCPTAMKQVTWSKAKDYLNAVKERV